MYTFEDIRPLLDDAAQVMGVPEGRVFDNVAATQTAGNRSLTWIAPHRQDKQELAATTEAAFVICDASVNVHDIDLAERCFIVVNEPKIAFSRIVQHLFVTKHEGGIHPTAVISPTAVIHETAWIGPFTYVGDAEVSAGSVVHGHCFIYDGVRIGRNVMIHAGCVIGGDGFGFARGEDGRLTKFPHLGGVVIEDDVEIQTLTHIDRGALADTIVRRGTKIDSCCHIAHNDDIGEDNIIAAHTMFSGSVTLGDRCWVGPSTSFRDVLSVGNDSFVGFGSLIAKSFPDNSEVMGSPARPVEDYKRMLSALKELSAAKPD
jgi:UDP-3-O-[3-hydroxymyristoyl] glucosamine N-acyltransferase